MFECTSVRFHLRFFTRLAEAIPLIFGNVVRSLLFLSLRARSSTHAYAFFPVPLQRRRNRPRLLLHRVRLVFPLCFVPSIADLPCPSCSRSVASFIGFGSNFYQERLYRKHVAKRGPEARLYSSLVGGLVFPAGALILAFSQGRGHWMGPIVGLVLVSRCSSKTFCREERQFEGERC